MLKRSKISRTLSLTIVTVVVISLAISHQATAQTSAEAKSQIAAAYAGVLAAEQSGGNVTSLVAKLNAAVQMVSLADNVNGSDPARAQSLYSHASALAAQVIQGARGVASEGKAAVMAAQVGLAVETIALAGLAALAYVFTPRLYWRFWFRTHKDWRVKKS